MTNDLEKQFFDTFGIEPKIMNTAVGQGFYIEHTRVEKYPQITDHILLELICIVSNYCQTKLQRDYQLYSVNTDELRQEVLKDCMEYCCKPVDIECIKHQVQALFKEER